MSASIRSRRNLLYPAVSAVALGLTSAAFGQLRPAQQIAIEGQEAEPGVNLADILTSPTISINSEGKVYFYARLSGSNVVTTGSFTDDEAGYVSSGGSLTLVARRDAVAADFPASPTVRYGDDSNQYFIGTSSSTIDGDGNVTLRPFLNGLSIVPDFNDQAFYIGRPGAIRLVAQRGAELPPSAIDGGLTAGMKYGAMNFNAVAQNGKLVFLSDVLTAVEGADAGEALFTGSNKDNVTTIAYGHATNGTMIGGDRLSAINTGRWTMNTGGEALFGGSVISGTATLNALIRGSSPGTLAYVGKQGQASGYADANFNTFAFSDRFISGSNIAFVATLAGSGVTTTNTAGRNVTALFMTDPSGAVRGLAREGEDAPSQPFAPDRPNTSAASMRFATMTDLKLAPDGSAVFSSQLRPNNATTATGVSTYDGFYYARFNPLNNNPEVWEIALENDRQDFSQAALHQERGDFEWHLDRWNGLDVDSTAIDSSGRVVFFGGASVPGSSLTEVDGYFIYEPGINRVFRLVAQGEQLMVDPDGDGPAAAAPQTITSITPISGSDYGAGSGGKSIINADGKLVFRANTSGGSGVFTLDVDDYIPTSFHVWNSTGGGTWSVDTNWTGNAPGGGRTYAELSSAITGPATINVDGPKTVGELFFRTPHKVTLQGDALTLQGVANLGHIGVAQGDHEIVSDLVLADSTSVILDVQTIPTGVTPTSVAHVPTSLLISGDISGPGDLRKGGPGTLLLTGNNTYTGDTIVRAGYLAIASNANLGSTNNALILDGGFLRFLSDFTLERPITVTGVVRDTSDMRGGIDTGTNTVTLTGPLDFGLSSTGANGVLVKQGTGKLVLAGTGGPGGVDVTAGILEVTTHQTWGAASNRVNAGASLVVTPTGRIDATGGFTALGGGTMRFDGPVHTTGTLQASHSTNGAGVITINAPSSFGGITTSSRSGTVSAELATININANTVVTGTVNLNSSGTNSSAVNLGPGVTLNAENYTIGGTFNSGPTNVIIQSGTTTSGSTFGLVIDSGVALFNPSGTVTTAADLGLSSTASSTLSGPVTIGRDIRLTGSANTLTINGPRLEVARDVRLEGGAATSVANLASPITTVGGLLWLDADANNENLTLNLLGASGTSGGMLVNVDTTGTANLTARATLNVGTAATHSTGDITLSANRSSTSTATGRLTGLVTLDIAGTLSGGDLRMSTNEGSAARNSSTVRVNVSGLASFNNIRQESRLNNLVLPAANVGNMEVNISGKVTIKPNGGTAGTSVLVELPNFTGDGKIDLTNNALIINYPQGQPSPLADTRQQIISGLAGGDWSGPGIVSSTAANNSSLSIGYGEASTILGPDGGEFVGQVVDGTGVLVRTTLKGDANLNGIVNFDDLARLAQNYNNTDGQRLWDQGDFTHDGSVNFDDLAALAQNYNMALPTPSALAALGGGAGFQEDVARAFAQVPEPGGLALIGLVAGCLFRRRRCNRALAAAVRKDSRVTDAD